MSEKKVIKNNGELHKYFPVRTLNYKRKAVLSLKHLENVFLEHHKGLYSAALSITRNSAQAEDCVHEALVAVATLDKPPENLPAYLYRVVRNKALHSNKLSQRSETLADDFATAHDDTELAMLVEQVKTHMKKLGLNEQQVIMMKLFADMTFEEVATIMEASPNTVASWYRRGLARLKELIND